MAQIILLFISFRNGITTWELSLVRKLYYYLYHSVMESQQPENGNLPY